MMIRRIFRRSLRPSLLRRILFRRMHRRAFRFWLLALPVLMLALAVPAAVRADASGEGAAPDHGSADYRVILSGSSVNLRRAKDLVIECAKEAKYSALSCSFGGRNAKGVYNVLHVSIRISPSRVGTLIAALREKGFECTVSREIEKSGSSNPENVTVTVRYEDNHVVNENANRNPSGIAYSGTAGTRTTTTRPTSSWRSSRRGGAGGGAGSAVGGAAKGLLAKRKARREEKRKSAISR